MSEVLAIGFLENIKVLFVGILIYALIFALLKKVGVFEDAKINSVIALIAAIIVSFSGVVTYAVSYAINWFVIILFVVFLIMVLMMFFGISAKDITGGVTKFSKPIFFILIFLFLIVFVKSFFALNNAYDINDPQNNSYAVDTSYNTGVDDITNSEIDGDGFFSSLHISNEILSAALFLLVLGAFVFLLGR